jgi:hypothetical protein
MGKVSSLNFAGQTLFCGIDVHKRSWRVNIRCNEFELADFSQDPREDILLRHLSRQEFTFPLPCSKNSSLKVNGSIGEWPFTY